MVSADSGAGRDSNSVERFRAETISHAKDRLKHYAMLAIIDFVPVALTMKGMPLHSLWSPLGNVALIVLCYFASMMLFDAATLVGNWMDTKWRKSSDGEA